LTDEKNQTLQRLSIAEPNLKNCASRYQEFILYFQGEGFVWTPTTLSLTQNFIFRNNI
jgi:hypothetical protein